MVLMGIVNNLIVNTGYYENPATDVIGMHHVRTNEKGILSIPLKCIGSPAVPTA